MTTVQDYLRRVRESIREVSVDELRAASGALVIDVREADEHEAGSIPSARWIPRGRLELEIEERAPDRDAEIVLYCAGGNRSALAAKALAELGYTRIASLRGGFAAWTKQGLPVDRPFSFSRDQLERYSRHLLLPEVGREGQAKLLSAKVLLLGAGGLGAPAALYLAAMGVGTIGVVDDDVVEASNLQRQIIHNTGRVGMLKVDSAARSMTELNPDVKVVRHPVRLSAANVLGLIEPYDLVIDGTDNFPTRYLLNDAALVAKRPVVSAAIFQFEGQVTVVQPFDGPCYRCIFPEAPAPGMAPGCNEAGVLGVLPGVMGVLQATEACKLILGLGRSLVGRQLHYDALEMRFREFKVQRHPACVACSDPAQPPQLVDYDEHCSARRQPSDPTES